VDDPVLNDELAKYQSEHLFASDALLQRRARSDDSQRNLIDAFRIMLYPLVLESETNRCMRGSPADVISAGSASASVCGRRAAPTAPTVSGWWPSETGRPRPQHGGSTRCTSSTRLRSGQIIRT
jgi:hypothetical protein